MIYEADFPFCFDEDACAACGGACCTGESGFIFVSEAEIEALAQFLGIAYDELKHRFLYKAGARLSIRERMDDDGFSCIFFDKEKRRCSVYPARPGQCRTFPFWDYFKTRKDEVRNECPGVKLL